MDEIYKKRLVTKLYLCSIQTHADANWQSSTLERDYEPLVPTDKSHNAGINWTDTGTDHI